MRAEKLIFLITVFILGACTPLPASPTEGSSVGQKKLTSPVSSVTPIASKVAAPEFSYSIYIKPKFDHSPEAWGICPQIPGQSNIIRPKAPKIDKEGNLYVFDAVNSRILKYSSGSILQIIAVPRNFYPNDPCENSVFSPPNIIISGDRIFMLFSEWRKDSSLVDRLAVFLVNGVQQQIIDLDAYYPLHSIYNDFLVPDRQGGGYLLLPPVGVLYLDSNFRTELLANNFSGFIYDNLVTGWDQSLYLYDPPNNKMIKWANERDFRNDEPSASISNMIVMPEESVYPASSKFIGVDQQGLYYFAIGDAQHTLWLERFSVSGDVKEFRAVPNGLVILQSDWQLAPDGTSYALVYQSGESSFQPEIIKVSFN